MEAHLLLNYLEDSYKKDFWDILFNIFYLKEDELSKEVYELFYDWYQEYYDLFIYLDYIILDYVNHFINKAVDQEMYWHAHMYKLIGDTVETGRCKGLIEKLYKRF